MTLVLSVWRHDQHRIHTSHRVSVSIESLVLPFHVSFKKLFDRRDVWGPAKWSLGKSVPCFISLWLSKESSVSLCLERRPGWWRGRVETVGKDPWKRVTATFSPVNQGKTLEDKRQKAKHCRVRSESQKTKSSSSHSSRVTQRMGWILWGIIGKV